VFEKRQIWRPEEKGLVRKNPNMKGRRGRRVQGERDVKKLDFLESYILIG